MTPHKGEPQEFDVVQVETTEDTEAFEVRVGDRVVGFLKVVLHDIVGADGAEKHRRMLSKSEDGERWGFATADSEEARLLAAEKLVFAARRRGEVE